MDFFQKAKTYEQEAIARLCALLKIPSVLDYKTASPEAPFGQAIEDALNYMLKIASEDGFKTVKDGGYAGHIEYGGEPEAEIVGILGHLDVVPAGSGWTYPPYEARIVGRKLYGRGAMDDKGPTMAAYYALKMLKDLQIPLQKRVRLILGTDEETAWRGLDHYFKNHEMPTLGFSPDSDFPLIYAEKGILHLELSHKFFDRELLLLKGGERYNIVIDEAEAITVSDFRTDFDAYLKNNHLKGTTLTTQKDNQTTYHYKVEGIASHAMEPEKGINAGTHLASFLKQVITNPLLDFVNDFFHQDFNLKRLDAFFEHPEMGLVTCNVGIINLSQEEGSIGIDIRYPIDFDVNLFLDNLKAKLKLYNLEITNKTNKTPHYVPVDSELVQTLYESYVKYTNDFKNKPKTIGGGTYARALKQGVAFGMEMPWATSQAHQRDEMMDIDDFILAMAIYAEAIMRLGR